MPTPVRWVLAAVLAVAGLVSVVAGLTVTSGPDAGPESPVAVAGPPGPVAEPVVAGRAAPAQPSLPASPPVTLDIPTIGVTTGLDPLGLNADDTVQVPTDFARAGWYTGAPTPGQTGPAVVLGHIDSFRGPAVFYRLGTLRPSDTVEITRADGVRATFVVDSVKEYAKDDFPTEEVYGATDRADLRLITCGGPFDSEARSYLNNIVVYAHLATPAPAAAAAPAPDAVPAPDATAAAPGAPAALAGITGPPTLYGRVVEVKDPATVVVEVQRRRITVGVIGLGSTPLCAQEQSVAFARRMLADQDVTLVPDPTLPTDGAAPVWPAYLVLGSQQSYTDAAVRAGWARAGTGRYAPGFGEEQRLAQADGVGMWGPTCR